MYWATSSPFITSLTVLAQVGSQLMFGLIAGYQVDAHQSKRVFLIVPNLVSAAIYFALAVMGVDSLPTLVWALIGYFIAESAAVYYAIVVPSVLPRIVGREHIASARTIIGSTTQVLVFVIPGLSTLLLSVIGAKPLFLFNALTFVVATE